MGSCHVLTDGYLFINFLSVMKKNQTLVSDAKGKSILQNAVQSSENEQMDLYKAIFGGTGSDCPLVAIVDSEERASAYDKTDQFLRA
ncbi:hypothetical protein [Mucilaginibacter sp. KACC 22063]|uniref:hypothetical protein n=1 Tax=Mucilaginibacter sp. KACC 22063 TaxID=3025666 RepID=UPI0023653D38|nr:hypothetical protein [Mucilaginibacter sp. KACC 22063]WDF57310.1 hypothetical protein PQ461_09615 [Mucilaginibacter sp. KACC 22063]